MHRKAGLTVHWGDYPDSKFFGYDPMGSSDDEGEGAPPPSPPRVPGGVVAMDAEAEARPRSGSEARAVPEPEAEPAQRLGVRRRVFGTKGVFVSPGIDSISFIATETRSFAHTAHTHTTHFLYLIYLLSLRTFSIVILDYNIAHRTLYSFVLLLSLLPAVMGCFV